MIPIWLKQKVLVSEPCVGSWKMPTLCLQLLNRVEDNEFVSRLLLHHFLDELDIQWLNQFNRFELSDAQKQALIFVREVGAIDNHSYRQMADCDTLKASSDLRALKSYHLLKTKGKGKSYLLCCWRGVKCPIKL